MFLRWGDVSATISGGVTLTPGVYPDSFALAVAYSGTPPPVDAELMFGDGLGGEVRIPNCRIMDGTTRFDAETRTVRFTAQDWRWRWAQSEPINGRYNQRDERGYIHTGKKSAQDIGVLLYAQLFTPAAKHISDIAALPADLYPSVDYQWANAAEELFYLAQRYGLTMAPYVDFAHVDGPGFWGARMWRQGEGSIVPELDRKWSEVPLAAVRKPKTVVFVGGRDWVQTEIALEAVGFHPVKKKFVALSETGEDELPYRPTNGFYPGFEEKALPFGRANSEYDAALATVYLYYRIKGIEEDGAYGWYLDGTWYSLEDLKARMLDKLTQVFIVDQERLFESSYVKGAWATGAGRYDPIYENSDPSAIVPVRYSLDARTGMVKFEDQVFGLGSDLEGELVLGAVFEGETYTKRLPTVDDDAIEGLVDVVRVDTIYELMENSTRVNEGQALEAAEEYVAAHLRRYEIPEDAQVNCYTGVVPLSPDGKIMQIGWYLDGAGPRTIISWGYEFDPSLIPALVREKDLDNNFNIRERRASRLATSLAGDLDATAPGNDPL